MITKNKIKKNEILKKNELISNIHLFVDKGICFENNKISLSYFSLKEELFKYFNLILNKKLKKNIKLLLKKKNLLHLDVIQLTKDLHPYDMDPRILLFLRFISIKEINQVQKVFNILPKLGDSKLGLSNENEMDMLNLLSKIFENILKKYDKIEINYNITSKTDTTTIENCISIIKREEKNVLIHFLNSIKSIKLK